MAQIIIVDQPDKDTTFEGQRTYHIKAGSKTIAVRIRRDQVRSYGYVIENLVGGKWNRLLEGDINSLNRIPFDDAIARAVSVLVTED